MLWKMLFIILVISFVFISSCNTTEPVGGDVSLDIPSAVENFIWGDNVEIDANSTNIGNVDMKLEDHLQPYSYNWDTSNTTYEEHTVKVKAYYDNGTENSQSQTVYYSPCPILEADLDDFVGITETNAQGEFLDGGNIDPDDWYFSERDSLFSFGPAYPNPTTQSSFIPFTLAQEYVGTMIILNNDHEILDILFDNDHPAQDYLIWNAPENVNDIYRCIFHIADSLHWHGDIEIQ